MSIRCKSDDLLQVYCDGCGDMLTAENVAGYRCYCSKCFDKFPPFPDDGRGYFPIGQYPLFWWIAA